MKGREGNFLEADAIRTKRFVRYFQWIVLTNEIDNTEISKKSLLMNL